MLSKIKSYSLLDDINYDCERFSKFLKNFNKTAKNNDLIDIKILYSVYICAVSCFITEDKDLIKKGKYLKLPVFDIKGALQKFEKEYEYKSNDSYINLPYTIK